MKSILDTFYDSYSYWKSGDIVSKIHRRDKDIVRLLVLTYNVNYSFIQHYQWWIIDDNHHINLELREWHSRYITISYIGMTLTKLCSKHNIVSKQMLNY